MSLRIKFLFVVMKSVVLISIYFLVCFEISNLKKAVLSFAFDSIPTLCVPCIKNTLKVIYELRILFLITKQCVKSRNYMPVAKKLVKMAIELSLAVHYQEKVSDIGTRDLNVSLLQLVESKLNFIICREISAALTILFNNSIEISVFSNP